MPIITCIDDMHTLYKKRVPKVFVDYCDSGSYTEQTYASNNHAFTSIKLRQRVCKDVEKRDLTTKMLGNTVRIPVAIAPTALVGMQRADGEILAAKAAEQFGVPFTLSTLSVCSIEDVATHTQSPFIFQLYIMKDKDFVQRLIARAKAAQCSALMVTLDMAMVGQRHKDIKSGLYNPKKLSLPTIINIMSKPGWWMKMAGTKRRALGNLVGHIEGLTDTKSVSTWVQEQFSPKISWDEIARIKEMWGGKLIVKGIMDEEDAVLAAKAGADAIVVSNHGGRQLDSAPATITVLPRIVAAVPKTEIWLDSGILTGQDVIKALALGATGTMIGRAYLYGLGAMGEEGVIKVLTILEEELSTTMGLTGVRCIKDINASILN